MQLVYAGRFMRQARTCGFRSRRAKDQWIYSISNPSLARRV